MVRPKILIVEDEIIIALTIQNILERKGYNILCNKASGEEAIKYLRHEKPDLILMDIMLAGDLDGIETVKKIKKEYKGAIVYLTAHSDESTIKRAKMTNPEGYILKPFKNDELYRVIENALPFNLTKKSS